MPTYVEICTYLCLLSWFVNFKTGEKKFGKMPHLHTSPRVTINLHFKPLKGEESKLLQVNLLQNLSFLNQLTHNMTRDCSLISKKNTSSQHVLYKNCFLFLFWHSKQYLYTTRCDLVFFLEFNEQSLVLLWVNWCKNEGFWKRFTCTFSSTLFKNKIFLH